MAHKRRDRSASDPKEMGTPFVCNDGVTIAEASVMPALAVRALELFSRPPEVDHAGDGRHP